jgi:RecB family exonuclease
MHRVLAETVAAHAGSPLAVVVPTSGAAEALAQTLERLSVRRDTCELVTRDELYANLHKRLRSAPPMLSVFEREVLLTRAATAANASGSRAPFRLRPGLIVEILAFYDELRRRDRTVSDFERLMIDSLQGSAEIDRGAERLFRQTRFLVAAFTQFEALVQASGRLDEHALRHRLLQGDGPAAYRRIVISIADQAADPRGLWTADFDMLARLPGLEGLDIVATENILAAGFLERIHDLLPGIEEEREHVSGPLPALVSPPHAGTDEPAFWFTCRDREEELVDFVRYAGPSGGRRTAIVFQRPLPYLYLARSIFSAAGQPYQALDSLPLAAEPFAAALDVVFSFIVAEANRTSIVDLLSSPHWQFAELSGTPASVRPRVNALDGRLRELKYFGGWDRLDALAQHPDFATVAPDVEPARPGRRPRANAGDALRAVLAAAASLRPVREASTASGQLQALVAFIRTHERATEEAPAAGAESSRYLRARGAVVGALESLAEAQSRFDDAPLSVDRLHSAVRRWIGGQTFSPRTGPDGMLLLDAPSAVYAEVDEMRLVGLVEQDWPERVRRSIFYPVSLLSQLGWPAEADRRAAARARFHDLLELPHQRVSVSAFTLEDDAIVSGSAFLQELQTSGLPLERLSERAPARSVAFAHEALLDASEGGVARGAEANAWLQLRLSRSPEDDVAYHGAAGPRAAEAYAVSHVERYIDCPFKYFAARVLRLDEERDDDSGLSPQERGQLLHTVFETFFARWQAQGGKTITADSLDAALELFEAVAESTLEHLPEADRALERNYLLGSAASAGLGERAFNFEIEQETPVIERLLEHKLEGTFDFATADGVRRVTVRGKADRIDLLDDGTLRVLDYKLGRAPKTARALQLPVYSACAEQSLNTGKGRRGRKWTVSSAGYVAFKEKNAFVPLGGSTSLAQALADGAARFVAAVDGIERGDFPVKPEEPFLCTRCGYSGVCRKDYIGDE